MSSYNKQDMSLLQEAYSVTLLREQAPFMTIGDIQSRIPMMSESELIYISSVQEKIVEEALASGLGALGRAAGSAIKSGLGAAGQAAGSAIKSGLGAAGQAASGVLQGTKAGAQQLGSNVKDIYKSGQMASNYTQAVAKAEKLIGQLEQLLQKAQADNLIKIKGDVKKLTLDKIINYLQGAQEDTQAFDVQAQQSGITGGVGAAAKKAFNRA